MTLKKYQRGYTWTVSVGASSNSEDDLWEALRKAKLIELAVAEEYGGSSDDEEDEFRGHGPGAEFDRSRRR